MRKFTILLALLVFIGMQVVNAQRTITGTVTSGEDGSAIPGASVVVKNTTIGTTTNVEGKYELTIPEDANMLVFSFVGMITKEIQVSGTTMDVVLEPDIMDIEGVVVTALGISREKKALGYAVQDVQGDDLAKAKEANIVNSLAGKVAGVQITNSSGAVGSSSRIVIRGNSSFGNNQPLFVVDGVPISNYSTSVSQWEGADFGNSAMDIDPENVESVSLLKGANAAALYGSRAANGVVLITTKSGQKGASKGIGVSFSTATQFDNVYILPNYQDKYGQGYGGSEYQAKASGIDVSDVAAYEAWARENSFSYYDGNWGGVMDGIDESWGPRLDIGMNIPQFNSPVDPDGENRQATPWVSNPDNVKDIFETGITQDNNLSLVAGTDKAAARLSLSRQAIKGAIPNTDLKKYTVNFNGSMELSKRLSAQATVNYTQNQSDNLPGGGYDENNIMQSVGGWFGRQVDMAPLEEKWDELDVFGEPYNWNRSYHNNVFWTLNKNTTSRDRKRMFGNFSLTYQLTDWLSAMGRVGTDFWNEYRKHVVADGSIESSFGGSFWQEQREDNETNIDFILTADKDFGEDFSTKVILGANYMNRKYHFMSLEAAELTVPDLYTIGNVNGNATTGMYDEERERNSVFGSASFAYKRFLYLDVTGRNDWSSTLPKDNWSYFYPSVSLSFVFTEAFDFLPNIFTFGKIRASWAQVGNATDPYQTVATYSSSADPFSGVAQYFYARELPPLELEPEKTTSTEIGADLKLFNNRLGLDFTYYDKTTKNQIMAVDISPASGFTSMRINAGEIQNKGVEVMLTGKVLKNKGGLNWDITLNWSTNENMVNELYGDLEAYQISSSWGGVTIEARPGETYGVIKGGAYVRDDNGNIIVGESGLPLHSASPEIIGNITPDWVGGIRNTFNYKDLSLSILIDGRKGGDIFSVTDWFGAYAGITEESAEGDIRENGLIVDGVKEDGTPNDIVVSAQDYYENYWGLHEPSIIDGSFIKLREIVLAYDLPQKWMDATGFLTSVNFSLYARNIALLYTDESNDVGIDPETGFGTSNSGMGLEQFQLPPTRSIGFKFKFNF